MKIIIDVKGIDFNDKLIKATEKAAVHNIDIVDTGESVDGKFRTGRILGPITGQYMCDNVNLTIEITKKPFLMPESLVRKSINDFFLG